MLQLGLTMRHLGMTMRHLAQLVHFAQPVLLIQPAQPIQPVQPVQPVLPVLPARLVRSIDPVLLARRARNPHLPGRAQGTAWRGRHHLCPRRLLLGPCPAPTPASLWSRSQSSTQSSSPASNPRPRQRLRRRQSLRAGSRPVTGLTPAMAPPSSCPSLCGPLWATAGSLLAAPVLPRLTKPSSCPNGPARRKSSPNCGERSAWSTDLTHCKPLTASAHLPLCYHLNYHEIYKTRTFRLSLVWQYSSGNTARTREALMSNPFHTHSLSSFWSSFLF